MTIDFSRFLPPPGSIDNERRWEDELAAREAAQRRQERALRLESAHDLRLTDEVHRALIEGVPMIETESLRAAKKWALGGERPCLILGGSVGCGKSVAAAFVLAQFGGMWLPAERALKAFAVNFGEGFSVQSQARDTGMLILDDVGTEDADQKMLSVLTELLDCRKSRRHRTVITTNLTRAKFEARYKSERLASRLSETVMWTSSSGSDLRRRQRRLDLTPRKAYER